MSMPAMRIQVSTDCRRCILADGIAVGQINMLAHVFRMLIIYNLPVLYFCCFKAVAYIALDRLCAVCCIIMTLSFCAMR